MNKSDILKTFNNHFEEFMDDIIRVFPNDSDLIACKDAIINMRKANPRLILVVFSENVVGPYKTEILNNDIKFFIEKNYNADVCSNNSDKILKKIDMLRGPVSLMNIDEQQKVLKYLNNLLKLTELYNK